MTSGQWPGQAPPICLELKQFNNKQVLIQRQTHSYNGTGFNLH